MELPVGQAMMAISLDGFVARPDHRLDWLMRLDTDGEDHGFEAFQDSVDAIVMGANSFRSVLGFGHWAYRKPVVVLSSRMHDADVPARLSGKAEISRLSPRDVMTELGRRGAGRVYVDGAAVIRSFLEAGLIAEMRIALAPVLIGEGIRLFGPLGADIPLTLCDVQQFPSGLVQMRYRLEG